MARNKVQFQKGLSEAEFDQLYGTEERCHAELARLRWPYGFECPDCGGRGHCVVKRGARLLFQCNACRKQTSVKAGTIFASSKLPLRLWFRAMYLVTQSKKGLSSIELGRRLGVTQTTAWTMKHKLAQVMMERNGAKRLDGNVQMDDAYIGGERSGKRGRGAAGKTPFVAAVATTEDGKPDQIILRRASASERQPLANLRAWRLAATPTSSPMRWPVSPPSQRRAARTFKFKLAEAPKPPKSQPSNGSTLSLETSSRLWLEPTGPCTRNTCRDISPNSNIGSTADTASKQ